MKEKIKYLLTGLIVAVAVILVLLKYWDYVVNPWTRDGQVRAQVIPPMGYVDGLLSHKGSDHSFDFMLESDTSPIDLITRRFGQKAHIP